MLCLQNISNIYRKNAFARILAAGLAEHEASMIVDHKPGTKDPSKLPLVQSLRVFDEKIDFSLEAAVPDPVPFEAKLRGMLDDHDEFILSEEQHAVGHSVLSEVGQFALVSESVNRLDTEQASQHSPS